MYASECNSFFSGTCYCRFIFDFQTMIVNIRRQEYSLNVLYLFISHTTVLFYFPSSGNDYHPRKNYVVLFMKWYWSLCNTVLLALLSHAHARTHTWYLLPYFRASVLQEKRKFEVIVEKKTCTNVPTCIVKTKVETVKKVSFVQTSDNFIENTWFPQNYYCIVVTSFQVILVRWNEPYQKLATCDAQGVIFVWIKHEGRWSVELINDRNSQVIRNKINTAGGHY